MVEDHDVPLELPAGLWAELWADHDHTLPDLGTLDLLQREGGGLAGADLEFKMNIEKSISTLNNAFVTLTS